MKNKSYYSKSICIKILVITLLSLVSISGISQNTKKDSVYHLLEKAFANPEKVIRLDLSNQAIYKLTDSIGMFKNLKEINLSGNNLETLPASFYSLKKLKVVKLNNNALFNLADFLNHSGSLESMEELDLSSNNLTYIPGSINNCKKLVKINLSNNYIYNLPVSFAQLRNLEYINISKNIIHTLENNFSDLFRLKHLDISENNLSIEQLDNVLGLFSKLTYLSVDSVVNFKNTTQLRFLQINDYSKTADFSELKKLNRLVLNNSETIHSDGTITTLEDLKNLDTLEILNATNNLFPEEICNLKQLKCIRIFESPLINMGKLFEQLSKIENLSDLTINTSVDSLPDQINKMDQLEKLILQDNNLTSVSKINRLDNLKYLDLSGNRIEENEINSLKKKLPDCDIFSGNQLIKNIYPPLRNIKYKEESTVINPKSETRLIFSSGTSIKIPENAFVDMNGNPVNSEVTVNYKKYLSPEEILLSGIPMTYNDGNTENFFSSGGMFKLEASSEGSPVKLKENKSLEIEMASNTLSPDYKLYVYDSSSGSWKFESKDSFALSEKTVIFELGRSNIEWIREDMNSSYFSEPKVIYKEKVFIRPRKNNTLKSFELRFLNTYTRFNGNDLSKKYPEMKYLRKYRWIYDGTSLEKDYLLMDSIYKVCRKTYTPFMYKTRDSKPEKHVKKYKALGPELISDVFLTINPKGDNLLMNIIFTGDTIKMPVYVDFSENDVTKIATKHKSVIDIYNKSYLKRVEDWSKMDVLFQNAIDEFESKLDSSQQKLRSRLVKKSEINSPSRFFTIRSMGLYNTDKPYPINYPDMPTENIVAEFYNKDSLSNPLNPNAIYIVDYTFNTVFRFFNKPDFSFYPSSKNALFVVFDNGEAAFIKPADFLKRNGNIFVVEPRPANTFNLDHFKESDSL
ncbi:MAG: hypothetical protein A2W91_10125 [Bacteroidetes bacterium GWF2_38_335]|nr:MAG: hypothetical protein A2W91_10125 [Bacteroidetes bacterium GWF2_38_335]HBS88019.1 hypothetical protein [Bacteroidales bacterium]